MGAGTEPEGSERRAWVRHPCDLGSKFHSAGAGSEADLTARILDISRGGINLVTNRSIDSGDVLEIQIDGVDEEDHPPLTVRVLHLRKCRDGDDWAVGCCFTRALSERDLRTILASR